ncbi:methyltransferase domain-containing protein [Cribrihabitans neustonicus]|uniref:methyltransferase domain-containing protein n=1 Tax=Cribrihabitans neustonicus TaxID=1429085 RepID=UPI003B5BC450
MRDVPALQTGAPQPASPAQSGFDQSRVRQSFRRGLSSYHRHATVQAEIASRLAALLADQGAPRRLDAALEFGCGTGHLTASLAERFEIGRLTLNDLVPEAAAATARAARPHYGALDILPGPVEALPLPAGLDLIASASTVQWLDDLPALMARLTAHLRPGGWLALSGFGRRQFRELAALGSNAAAPSYLDAREWPAILPEGLRLVALEQRPMVLEFGNIRTLLRHLRLTGVNGNARQGWSRARLREFEAAYQERFGRGGRLPLSYDPVWLVARKEA